MGFVIFSDAWPVLSDETDDEPEVHCTPNRDDIRGICLIRLGELNAPSDCLFSPLMDKQHFGFGLPSVVS